MFETEHRIYDSEQIELLVILFKQLVILNLHHMVYNMRICDKP